MTDQQSDGQTLGATSATADSYTAAFPGGTTDIERRRLDLQAELYGRLSAWTLDALGLGPGQQVADLGCGTGALLPLMAERVGPAGHVIGVDRDGGLLAAAREQVTPYPWVELVEADALTYAPTSHSTRSTAASCSSTSRRRRSSWPTWPPSPVPGKQQSAGS
jgi:SAM-dependent methyltransferase